MLQEGQVFSLLAFYMAYQLIACFMRSASDYKDGAKRCKKKNSEGVGEGGPGVPIVECGVSQQATPPLAVSLHRSSEFGRLEQANQSGTPQ